MIECKNNILTSLEARCLTDNTPLHIDNKGGITVASGWSVVFRWVLPGYARSQDRKIAQVFSERIRTRDCDISNNDYHALKNFVNHRLKRYWLPNIGKIKQATVDLEYCIKYYQLADKLRIDQNVLRENPDFFAFAVTNRLQYKTSRNHVNQGIIPKYENGQILLPFRDSLKKETVWKPWTELPTTDKGFIDSKQYEFGAWGWQKLDEIFIPCELVDSGKKLESGEYYVELVTVKPKGLGSLGSGCFGHTYIRFYEPQQDGKHALYALGYDLKHIVPVDFMESRKEDPAHREYTTREMITEEEFVKMQQWFNTNVPKLNDPNCQLPEELEKWQRENCITCANFAVKMFEMATDSDHKTLDGRIPLLKAVHSERVCRILDKIWSKLPGSIQKKVVRKVQFITRGMLPAIMIHKQKNREKYLRSAVG